MSVGESPVNTLDVQSPEVAIAQKTLQQVCREILAEGWKFNTETQTIKVKHGNMEIRKHENMKHENMKHTSLEHRNQT